LPITRRGTANSLLWIETEIMAAEYIRINPSNPDSKSLNRVVDCLKAGGVIVYPTDTVYGIGCDMENVKAVERVARIREMDPKQVNFAIICHNLSHLSSFASVGTNVFKMMKKAFPGPFTFLLKANKKLPSSFQDRRSIGIRIPDNEIPLQIVEKLGNPIITTSVHDDDTIIDYTTDPSAIYENFKDKVDIVIDAGFGNNIPSTIIDCTGDDPVILRQGLGNVDAIF